MMLIQLSLPNLATDISFLRPPSPFGGTGAQAHPARPSLDWAENVDCELSRRLRELGWSSRSPRKEDSLDNRRGEMNIQADWGRHDGLPGSAAPEAAPAAELGVASLLRSHRPTHPGVTRTGTRQVFSNVPSDGSFPASFASLSLTARHGGLWLWAGVDLRVKRTKRNKPPCPPAHTTPYPKPAARKAIKAGEVPPGCPCPWPRPSGVAFGPGSDHERSVESELSLPIPWRPVFS